MCKVKSPKGFRKGLDYESVYETIKEQPHGHRLNREGRQAYRAAGHVDALQDWHVSSLIGNKKLLCHSMPNVSTPSP